MLQAMRNTVTEMWKVAEEMESIGLGGQIPFVSNKCDIRHAMKAELLMLLFAIAGENEPDEKKISFLQYVLHAPINDGNKKEYVKTICREGVHQFHSLLPYFCVIDKEVGCDSALVYLKFIAAMAMGYIRISGSLDLGMIQRYMAITGQGKQLIDARNRVDSKFDPLDSFDEESKNALKIMCKTDPIYEKGYELYQSVMTVLVDGKETSEKETAFAAFVKQKKQDLNNSRKDHPCNCEEQAEASQPASYDELFTKLHKMTGLYEVKRQVQTMANMAKISMECKKLGIERPQMSYHMVFSGNPGTGKTTIARLMAQIYCSLGLLSKGHLVEVSRAELVAEYVGHTAIKVKSVLEKAKGGVLFIDEAYSLVNASINDFGHEAIATLIKGMEDYRDDLVVIVAGYPDLMMKFLDSNPGLQSRFSKTIYFPDYNSEELESIFCELCNEYHLKCGNHVLELVRKYLQEEVSHKRKNFGNARAVRTFFEEILFNQANRLASKDNLTETMLCRITAQDIPQKFYVDNLYENAV